MAWLKLVESAGNQLLQLDPDLLEQLKPFYGKTFRIEFIEPSFAMDLRPCPDGFIIEAASDATSDAEPDVSLRGSLWAFVQLAKEGAHSDVFHQGKITMQGDAELGQAFQRVFATLDIDWEEILSKFIGDMAARNISLAAQEVKSWFNQSNAQFKQNTGEYLQEELRVTPAKVEVDAMNDEIETLRSDAARLEARIAKIKAALILKETDNKHA